MTPGVCLLGGVISLVVQLPSHAVLPAVLSSNMHHPCGARRRYIGTDGLYWYNGGCAHAQSHVHRNLSASDVIAELLAP